VAVCARCGQENPEGFRFCGACGAALSAGAVSEERKVVTVLFADLVGFTSRSERMDVEDVRGTLAPYHALLRERLEHYGGTVEKFIGDAVMALFGAPIAHEDDPERAVRAALAIRAAIAALNDDEPGLDLHVRVGINTGEALVVLGADAARGEGMASGDVVNTAARLQTAAPVDGILVGETTYRATDRAVTYRSAEPVVAKGKSHPVPVWEAVEARARLGVDVVQRPTTPLVGRGEEIDLLLDALRRCRSERAVQLVTVVGVPGIGKSRLVWELMQAVERDADFITWRQGRSLPYGDGVTYWALGEMVKAQAGILDSDTAKEAEVKLHVTVADLIHDPTEAAWVEEHLRALAGLERSGGDARDRTAEASAAWRRFLEALADRNPLVLVFEDLHWADDALLDFVDHLADWARDVPMLVVCTARPELLDRRGGWGGGKRNALTVALSPLADADIARLISKLLEQALLPAETQVILLSTAAGNPLYAEEYVRMLIDRGHLRHQGGRWQLAVDVELRVPESVQGLIAARLDDLPAEQKRLLQDAAVLGKVVWLGALSEMSGIDRYQAEAHLHALERREMLRRERRSSVAADTEYAFRHVLMRDVAYGQIPRAQRAEKHRRAAAWIESLAASRGDTPDMLAHHYARALEYARDTGQPTAELEARARTALRNAGDRAVALSSLTAAQQHYAAALELWPRDDPEWPYIVIATADAGLGTTGDEMSDALERARDLLEASGELADAAQADMLRGFRYWNEGRGDEALSAMAGARSLIEQAEPSAATAHVASRLAINSMLRGSFDDTVAMCERVVAIAEEHDLEELRAHVLNTRGVARVVLRGDLGGLDDMEESLEIVERLNDVAGMIRGYKNLGSTLGELGQLDRATELERCGAEVARRFGVDFQVVWFETELALLAYYDGDWEAATDAFERLDRWVERVGPHYMEGAILGKRAQIRAARGELGVQPCVDQALDFGRRSGEPQVLFPALGDAALIAAMSGDADAGRRVAELFDELVEAVPGGVQGSYWTTELALALALTDQHERFAVLDAAGPSRWLTIAQQIADGRYAVAADSLAEIGARPHEAFARLLAARVDVRAGNSKAGEAQLLRATGFWAGVGATRYVDIAEELMAQTA
jgi:class 3 adenylate cyclase/tetratricopeptide (TPR) repeat protein